MSYRTFSRFLSSDGTSGGTKDMATTADEYFIRDTTRTLVIERMLVSYQDGAGGLSNEYGNLGDVLANGIEVKVTERDQSTVIVDLTDGVPIVQNADWARFCYDFNIWPTTADDIFGARWTFGKSGQPVVLEPGESLRMYIQDDLTELTDHFALVQGHHY